MISHIDALLKPLFFIDVDDSKSHNVSVSMKQGLQTVDHGLQTVDHGLQTGYKAWTRHKMRTRNYRLSIKHGIWTGVYKNSFGTVKLR